jgi:hypothetical protein
VPYIRLPVTYEQYTVDKQHIHLVKRKLRQLRLLKAKRAIEN